MLWCLVSMVDYRTYLQSPTYLQYDQRATFWQPLREQKLFGGSRITLRYIGLSTYGAASALLLESLSCTLLLSTILYLSSDTYSYMLLPTQYDQRLASQKTKSGCGNQSDILEYPHTVQPARYFSKACLAIFYYLLLPRYFYLGTKLT